MQLDAAECRLVVEQMKHAIEDCERALQVLNLGYFLDTPRHRAVKAKWRAKKERAQRILTKMER